MFITTENSDISTRGRVFLSVSSGTGQEPWWLRLFLPSIASFNKSIEIIVSCSRKYSRPLRNDPLISSLVTSSSKGKFGFSVDLPSLSSPEELDSWQNLLGFGPSPRGLYYPQNIIKRVLRRLTLLSPDHRPIILVDGESELGSSPETIYDHLQSLGLSPILYGGSKSRSFIDPNEIRSEELECLVYLSDAVITGWSTLLPISLLVGRTCISPFTIPGFDNHKTLPGKDPLEEIRSILRDSGIPIRSTERREKVTKGDDRVGLRIQGLLGDSIKASSLIPNLAGSPKIDVLLSYPDQEKHGWVRSLYRELLDRGIVDSITSFSGDPSSEISREEISLLRDCGCSRILDCNVTGRNFDRYDWGKPDLAIENYDPIPGRVALMRASHLHRHFPSRNRPYSEWREVESFLLSLGLFPEILGWDDYLPNDFDLPDYRRRLDPLSSVRRAMGAQIVISTATFVPVMTSYYRPTIVLSDPDDIEQLKNRWYSGAQPTILDATGPYLEVLKEKVREILREQAEV